MTPADLPVTSYLFGILRQLRQVNSFMQAGPGIDLPGMGLTDFKHISNLISQLLWRKFDADQTEELSSPKVTKCSYRHHDDWAKARRNGCFFSCCCCCCCEAYRHEEFHSYRCCRRTHCRNDDTSEQAWFTKQEFVFQSDIWMNVTQPFKISSKIDFPLLILVWNNPAL